MKKKRPAPRAPVAKAEQVSKPAQSLQSRPLRPRPVLLGVLSVILGAWIVLLLVWYFTTVRAKHDQPATAAAAGFLDI